MSRNWITKDEHDRAFYEAEQIFGDWVSRIATYDEDYWVSVDIDGKVFDLNLWQKDDGKWSYCTIHPTKVNNKGQLETVGTEYIRMITMERHSYE
jgi:hypothetical protein|tara:strand:- start:776 stop:1060 length:285 start_codon:yes stop_codon:yes gene_type:complete